MCSTKHTPPLLGFMFSHLILFDISYLNITLKKLCVDGNCMYEVESFNYRLTHFFAISYVRTNMSVIYDCSPQRRVSLRLYCRRKSKKLNKCKVRWN